MVCPQPVSHLSVPQTRHLFFFFFFFPFFFFFLLLFFFFFASRSHLCVGKTLGGRKPGSRESDASSCSVSLVHERGFFFNSDVEANGNMFVRKEK